MTRLGSFAVAMLALLILTLSGCKANLTLDLYSSDLPKVGESSLTTPGMLAMEIPSAQECTKYTKQISQVVKDLVNNFKPRGCINEEMESFLTAAIDVPLLPSGETWESESTLFGVVRLRK